MTEYYDECLQRIGSKDIIVFTNDYNLIFEIYPNLRKYDNLIIRPEITCELLILYLMSKCKLGGICSNSTFSWW